MIACGYTVCNEKAREASRFALIRKHQPFLHKMCRNFFQLYIQNKCITTGSPTIRLTTVNLLCGCLHGREQSVTMTFLSILATAPAGNNHG